MKKLIEDGKYAVCVDGKVFRNIPTLNEAKKLVGKHKKAGIWSIYNSEGLTVDSYSTWNLSQSEAPKTLNIIING